MKKIFLIAAMAGAILVSCTKIEHAATNDEQLISFAAPIVSLNTKAATEVHNNYPTSNDFAVWAHYYEDDEAYTFAGGQVYMNDAKVTHTAWTWEPETAYYWPKNGSLTFIAYAPSSVNATVNASGIQIAEYTVSNTAAQVDLLFSERAYNKKAADDNKVNNTAGTTTSEYPTEIEDPYKGVHISFKHALSSILFTAKVNDDLGTTKITLQKIELTGINSVGTFNQGLADESGAATVRTADLWTGEKTPTTYSITIQNGKVLTTTEYYTCNGTTNAPGISNGKRATDFILLPQVISADAKLKVTYTIQKGSGSILTQELEVPLQSSVTEWKWGYRYIYNIIVGLDRIGFEPYVAPWVEADSNGDTVEMQ